MPVDGSDIPLRMLNISLKLPLPGNAAANDEPKSQLPSPHMRPWPPGSSSLKAARDSPKEPQKCNFANSLLEELFANADSGDKLNVFFDPAAQPAPNE